MHGYSTTAFLLSAGVDLYLTSFLWTRRGSGTSMALAGLCLSNAVWCLGFGGALMAEQHQRPDLWMHWGQVQYLGIAGLVPFWVVFVLLWTKRTRYLNRWLITPLFAEGLLGFLIVMLPSTHRLIRGEPVRLAEHPWRAETGILYWFHYSFILVVLLVTTGVFLVDLYQRSRVYRRAVVALTFAALFPFAVNLAFNFELTRIDYTPVGFSTACCVLTWGVISQGLLRLGPIAHRQMVDELKDAVLVVDGFGNVMEANPAAQTLLASLPTQGRGLVKRPLPAELEGVVASQGSSDLRLRTARGPRDFEIQVNDLTHAQGDDGGRLVVLRDITERRENERQRTHLLAEQARVADTLSRSLRPESLPVLHGITFAAEYQPASGGRDLSGDFYDVYRCDDYWAFSVGDVSGKGAPAAAVTALARYTLRALTTSRLLSPPLAVKALNRQILLGEDQEKYLTVVHGWCQAGSNGEVLVDFVLGGHPGPVLLSAKPEPARSIGVPGTAVGLLPTVDLTNEHVVLAPGDALVFYTDGVTEARRGREFFGEERVVAFLEAMRGADADEIARSLMAAVQDFQRGQTSDDTAIFVIQAPFPSPFA